MQIQLLDVSPLSLAIPTEAPVLLRIGGVGNRLIQIQDFDEPTYPGGRGMNLLFQEATLADANNNHIFTGVVSVRMIGEVPAASLTLVSRLLYPFQGSFTLCVMGSYTAQTTYAQVIGKQMSLVDIQPS